MTKGARVKGWLVAGAMLATSACASMTGAPSPSPAASSAECAITAAALEAYVHKAGPAEIFATALPQDWFPDDASLPTSSSAEFRDFSACREVQQVSALGSLRLLALIASVEVITIRGQRFISRPSGTFVSRPQLGPSPGNTIVVVAPPCDASWRVLLTRSESGEWIGVAEKSDDIVMCHERRR